MMVEKGPGVFASPLEATPAPAMLRARTSARDYRSRCLKIRPAQTGTTGLSLPSAACARLCPFGLDRLTLIFPGMADDPIPAPASAPAEAPPAPAPAGPPPPTATAVVTGKSQREIELERELDETRAGKKKAEMDAAALIDEKERLKKAGAQPSRNFLEKFLADED